jgi:hypothetical protein
MASRSKFNAAQKQLLEALDQASSEAQNELTKDTRVRLVDQAHAFIQSLQSTEATDLRNRAEQVQAICKVESDYSKGYHSCFDLNSEKLFKSLDRLENYSALKLISSEPKTLRSLREVGEGINYFCEIIYNFRTELRKFAREEEAKPGWSDQLGALPSDREQWEAANRATYFDLSNKMADLETRKCMIQKSFERAGIAMQRPECFDWVRIVRRVKRRFERWQSVVSDAIGSLQGSKVDGCYYLQVLTSNCELDLRLFRMKFQLKERLRDVQDVVESFCVLPSPTKHSNKVSTAKRIRRKRGENSLTTVQRSIVDALYLWHGIEANGNRVSFDESKPPIKVVELISLYKVTAGSADRFFKHVFFGNHGKYCQECRRNMMQVAWRLAILKGGNYFDQGSQLPEVSVDDTNDMED